MRKCQNKLFNKIYSVKKYKLEDKQAWSEFVKTSKNGTFLFHRDFMEYHQDRFEDYSLMIYRNKKLIALLPANKKGDKIYSHLGLTYGGLIFKGDVKFYLVLEVFRELLKHLYSKKINSLEIKLIPTIYNQLPSDEINYIMFLLEAKLVKKETLSTICQKEMLKFSNDRIKGIKRGLKSKLVIKNDDKFDEFWNNLLIPNLKNKYNTKPVHTLNEIQFLKSKFPDNIKQFNIYYQGEVVAGTTVFETRRVAHSQYISSNNVLNNKLGSLDVLHEHLIKKVFKDKAYFDLGSSNVANGRKVNKSLQYWKEGFGARTVVQDFYEIRTVNYLFLNSVFV